MDTDIEWILNKTLDKKSRPNYWEGNGWKIPNGVSNNIRCSWKYGIYVIGLSEGKWRENSAEKDI